MTEAVLVVSVLLGLAGAFYFGMRTAKAKTDLEQAEANADLQKRLLVLAEQHKKVEEAFEDFKIRVSAAKSAADLRKLLQSALS